jgi:hypothetical protein
MTNREALRRLIDELREADIALAGRMLRGLAAPLDDELDDDDPDGGLAARSAVQVPWVRPPLSGIRHAVRTTNPSAARKASARRGAVSVTAATAKRTPGRFARPS